MTKKDYELIAKAIRRAIELHLSVDKKATASSMLSQITYELSNALKFENPRFDEKKFLEAIHA